LRVVPADEDKSDEAEFIMLKDGVIEFEGSASELRASKDSYLRRFLS
jgi:ABC-type transporter Mla maintaining outer membrane lipid asymmetry ATPase subunit MlaF